MKPGDLDLRVFSDAMIPGEDGSKADGLESFNAGNFTVRKLMVALVMLAQRGVCRQPGGQYSYDNSILCSARRYIRYLEHQEAEHAKLQEFIRRERAWVADEGVRLDQVQRKRRPGPASQV